MATVLDFTILSSLSIIFVFIAVFIGAWALMMMVNPFSFKDDAKKKTYSVMAFALAFLVIMSPPVLSIIVFSVPWFALLLIVAFFLLFFAKVVGPKGVPDDLSKQSVVYGFMIFFTVVIILFGLANSFGQVLLEEQPGYGADADRIRGDVRPVDTFSPTDEAEMPGTFDPDSPPPVNQRPAGAIAQDDIASNIVLTLFHPRILGMLFMMLLATITMLLIAK
jgi:hypothetical protein